MYCQKDIHNLQNMKRVLKIPEPCYFMQDCCRFAKWHYKHMRPGNAYMYMSVNWGIIGSGNGLVPVRHQAIT